MRFVPSLNTLLNLVAPILVVSSTFAVSTSRAVAAVSTESRQILDEAAKLTVETAKTSGLEKVPRAKLVTAIREGLLAGEVDQENAANAARALKVSEALPDLEKSFDVTGAWPVLNAIGDLAPVAKQSELARKWMARWPKFEAATKVIVYDTLAKWQIPLSDQQFDQGLKDDRLDLREEVAKQFFRTRERLTLEKQLLRYQRLFITKPAAVRRSAILDFEGLPPSQRKTFADSLLPKLKKICDNETQATVKSDCEKLLQELK